MHGNQCHTHSPLPPIPNHLKQVEITTLIAKPKGLVPGQTTTVKGGGSSLLERLVQRYKAKNVEKIRL
jgi:hypothetical protein